MRRIVFLGTSLYPSEGENVCLLVDTDDFKLLIDCCPGVIRQLKSLNYSVAQIGHIFLTHIHGGHVLGFSWIIGLHLYKVDGIRVLNKRFHTFFAVYFCYSNCN